MIFPKNIFEHIAATQSITGFFLTRILIHLRLKSLKYFHVTSKKRNCDFSVLQIGHPLTK